LGKGIMHTQTLEAAGTIDSGAERTAVRPRALLVWSSLALAEIVVAALAWQLLF
jgi:hypothetical protein